MPDEVFYCAGVPIAVRGEDGTLRRVALTEDDRTRIESTLSPDYETAWVPSLLTDEMEWEEAARMRRRLDSSVRSAGILAARVVQIPVV